LAISAQRLRDRRARNPAAGHLFAASALKLWERALRYQRMSRSAAGHSGRTALFGLSYKDARRSVLEAFELRYVTWLLAAAGGNVAAAARQGQMDRTHLIKLVQRHGLRAR
jgi:DNA-binding NtrC family response regulator